MATYEMQVGKTGEFGYVGIQPPLNAEQITAVESAGVDLNLGFRIKVHEIGEPYTEGSHLRGRDGDEHVVNAAKDIGTVLEGMGHEVFVDDTLKSIGGGLDLFGCQERDLL